VALRVLAVTLFLVGTEGRIFYAISRDDRRLATIGLIVGAVPVVWFLVYMISRRSSNRRASLCYGLHVGPR
jgi:hypothetical protein